MESFNEWMDRVVGKRPDITADWNDVQINISTYSNYGTELKESISHAPNLIQKTLMIKMLVMVEQMNEMQMIKQKADNILDKSMYYLERANELVKKYDLKAIRDLGFTSASINEKDKALYEKYIKEHSSLLQESCNYSDAYRIMRVRMELIVEMKEYWGDDALLVPFNDFEKVCNKYNLTCGLFEEYTGHVPTDKIGKISEIQRKLKDAGNYWIGYDGVIKKLYRIVEAKLWGYYYENNTPHLRECVDRVDSVFPFTDSANDNGYNLSLGNATYLFICAPKKYMRGAPKPIINYTDPFICAYTDYGIMILEKWDLEAEDDIIKSHEQKQSSFVNGVKSFFKWLSEP